MSFEDVRASRDGFVYSPRNCHKACGLIDTNSDGDMIGAVPEEKQTRGASLYDVVIEGENDD